jgi:hypothetical protein
LTPSPKIFDWLCGIGVTAMTEPEDVNTLIEIAKQGKINPFELLGLPAWIVNDLPMDQLKELLKSYKKTLAKLYHPDSPLQANKSRYQQQLAMLANQALQELLSDDWYIKKCAHEYRNGSVVDQLNKKIKELELKKKENRAEINSLKTKVGELESEKHEMQKSYTSQVRQHRKELLDQERTFKKEFTKIRNSFRTEKNKKALHKADR